MTSGAAIEKVRALAGRLGALRASVLARSAVLQVMLMFLLTMEKAIANTEDDPEALIGTTTDRANAYLSALDLVLPHCQETKANERAVDMRRLFENAWTTYSAETFDHSVEQVKKRLVLSGYDQKFFSGKTCFDGGCGTGRLSIAMAELGARKVVAVDVGTESLEFMKRQLARRNVSAIDAIEGDATDLSAFADSSFDFVASYGVLHHTRNMRGGIVEHFRILRPGGVFWLYLYGPCLYWQVYDAFRGVTSVEGVREELRALGVREGLIYTFLDNFFAPREYIDVSETVALLQKGHPLTWSYTKGSSPYDDTLKLLATRYGARLMGEQGEVRLAVQKSA